MAGDNPFGITQVDVPGLIGIYQGAQDRRVNQMLLQRKIALEDRNLERAQKISDLWASAQDPYAKGGGQPSRGGVSGAYAPAPAAPAAPAASPAAAAPAPASGLTLPYLETPATASPAVPVTSPTAPAAPAGAPPSPASGLPPVDPATVTHEDQTYVSANADRLHQMMGIDPKQGMAFLKFAQGMDADHRAQIVDGQKAVASLAQTASQLPYEQRRAFIQQNAQALAQAHPGVSPDMISSFDPTDLNISRVVNESIGVQAVMEQAAKTATATEAHRHNVADETNTANNGYLSAGLLPPGSPAVGTGGAAVIPATPGAPRYTGPQIEAQATAAIPGIGVSSRMRDRSTQQRLYDAYVNYRDHGGPWAPLAAPPGHSGHQNDAGEDLARDFTPPQGMSIGQLHAKLAVQFPGAQVLNEGNHVHVGVVPGHASASPGTGPGGLQIIPGGKLDHSPGADGTPVLDDQGITYAAQIYANTGQMPSVGMGKQAAQLRAQIISRAAKLDADNGISGTDRAGRMADYKADRGALTTLSRTTAQVLASENTARQNGQQVLTTMVKGAGTTGVPLFNRWQQAGRTSISGDADASAFNLAVQTFATEYAKVVSGATGGAVTSDSARHEIMGMINNAQTPDQLRAVISQANREMENRRTGLLGQQEALRNRLSGKPEGGASAPSTGWGKAQVVQ